MREIKFRAWDGEKMLEPVDLSQNGKYWPEWFGGQDVELMQYTGLKDKNGKEIYEGDIIKAHNHSLDLDFVKPVSYENGTFTIGHYWDDGEHEWKSMEQYQECNLEVIGNIYQHPELLCKSTT